MQQIHPENWITIYFGLVFVIACAQMVVVYTLSSASNPAAGLGLYTVYFMAALLGLIAVALQYRSDTPMRVDIASAASVLYSYLLLAAAGQRAQIKAGRIVLGIACTMACASILFLKPRDIFGIQAAGAAFFFALAGLLCGWRCWKKSNVGDAITAVAALTAAVGLLILLSPDQQLHADYLQAKTVAFALYSSTYVLVAVGFLASVLIENQQKLSHVSTQDPLTRLLNRHGLEQTLQTSLALAARQELPTSAISVHIDHFKEVNNNFGSKAGDQVLRQIAQALQRISRASDTLARVGGEEYLLILSCTELDNARKLAERIRLDAAENALNVNQQQIAVTLSVGVAATFGAVELDRLSRDAERAMQLAKRGGGNRVASVKSKPIHLSTHVN